MKLRTVKLRPRRRSRKEILEELAAARSEVDGLRSAVKAAQGALAHLALEAGGELRMRTKDLVRGVELKATVSAVGDDFVIRVPVDDVPPDDPGPPVRDDVVVVTVRWGRREWTQETRTADISNDMFGDVVVTWVRRTLHTIAELLGG